jgi:hypothetical protein
MVQAMAGRKQRWTCGAGQRGQAALLLLGVLAALLVGTLILFGFGQALGARGKHQRGADLAAVSAAETTRWPWRRQAAPRRSPASCDRRGRG